MFRNREISMNHIQPQMTMLSKEFIEILTFSGALQVFINFFLNAIIFVKFFVQISFWCWLSHLLHSPLVFFLHKYVACNFEHFKNDFFKIYSTMSEWTGKNVTTIRECIFWTCRTLNWMRSIFYSIQT